MNAIVLATLLTLPLLAGCEPALIKDAKESVKSSVFDPESAQFRDVQHCSKPNAVQGDVNSKNGFGGYIGFKPFIYVEGEGSEILTNLDSSALDHWEKLSELCWPDEILEKSGAETAKVSSAEPALATVASPPMPTREPEAGPEAKAELEPEVEPEPEAKQPVSMCFQDYCPCEPPQGGADAFFCRRLKAGLPVDDEQMSLGAGARDARRQLRQFEAEHGPF